LSVSGEALSGLGSVDMKGAIAAMLATGRRVVDAGRLSHGSVKLVFSADEENGSEHGMAWLAREGHTEADAAIVCEPASFGAASWEKLYVGQRGSAVFWIDAHGRGGHSGEKVPGIDRAAWAAAQALSALTQADCFHDVRHWVDGTTPQINA